ncbi:MAG: DedA family protein [Pseudolysinimonas sp.]
MSDTWVDALSHSAWLFPLLFLLVVGDAFFVVLPSETVVVALGTLWGATGAPPIVAVIVVAATGAIVGDSLCFSIGHRVGLDRWRWQRTRRLRAAIARVRETVMTRPATLIFTARYIPFARIAVNLTAGASGLPYRRFLPLSAAAGIAWAIYNCAVGAFFGSMLSDQPVLAIAISVAVAITIGLAVDRLVSRVARRPRAPGRDR